MTCGTHTTANVTAAAFGFNPLLSGSFLKWHDSCECTICSLFRKYHPCRVQQAGPAAHDTQIVILTLALFFFFFSPFNFFGCFLFFILASWPTALRACWTCRSWCPFVLYFGDRGSLLPYFVTFQTSPTSASSSRRKVIANTHSFLRVCVCVCGRACVCVYIYKKRE